MSRRGFTLIDEVLFIALLGILMAAALPKFSDRLFVRSKLAKEGYNVTKVITWCDENGIALNDFYKSGQYKHDFKMNRNPSPQNQNVVSGQKFCPYCGHSLP